MLSAGREVRIVKSLLRPRSQVFTIRTDSKLAFLFFSPTVNWQVAPILDKQRCIKEQIYFELLYVSHIKFTD